MSGWSPARFVFRLGFLVNWAKFCIMSQYHHTTISRRPVRSTPNQAKTVADVVFEADDPHAATAFILDALDALGIPRAGSDVLTEFGKIDRLDQFPFGPNADKPDWQNESVKLWLIETCR
jgi:hypothetical protein